MQTYQEYAAAVQGGKGLAYIGEAIAAHINSAEYQTAKTADEYDAQRNVTINQAARYFYSLSGKKNTDFTASNNRIASNFFHKLNNDRVAYSLGNGVMFDAEGVKERLGKKFDTDINALALYALEHGVAFGFWNINRLHVFPLTEFVPLWDEENGTLRAGIRFWCLDRETKPVYAVLYEEDGYTKYRTAGGRTGLTFEVMEEKRAYRQTVQHTEAGGDEIVGEGNYSALPIVPMYGNRHKQSTLVGMRAVIDAYDLVASGFCNDITDTSQVYWIIGNALGMEDADVQRFMDRLRLNHVAVVDTDNSSVTPYTQEPPYNAREACLNRLEEAIYRDFGGFNPEDVAAGRVTATQITAAYQPMDVEADAFEYCVIEFMQPILALQGMAATPQFKRNRIANMAEQVQMVMQEASYLDEETVIELLPNINPDVKEQVMLRRYEEGAERFGGGGKATLDEVMALLKEIKAQLGGEKPAGGGGEAA